MPEVQGAIPAGDIDSAGALGEDCVWQEGHDYSSALDFAFASILEEDEAATDFHVCNNDAALQADWWAQVAEGNITECDGWSEVCGGPMWYFSPEQPTP